VIHRLSRVLMSIGLILLLAACGGAAATATPPPTNTPVPPTNTAVPPTNTAVPPTNTPVPPTATAVPPTATAVPPTATTAPPTATRPAPTATRPAATATRPAASVAPGAGKVLKDSDNVCQATVPSNFTVDADGNASAPDDNLAFNLVSFPVDAFGFEGTVEFISETLAATLQDYTEVDNQSGTDRGRPFTVITFTATSVGEDIIGQFYFVQENTNVCALTAIVLASQVDKYQDIMVNVVDSVKAVTP
jgi:hypothetical protein